MNDLSKITCIEDLRLLARRRVPRMFYDYADSGSYTEGTCHANQADFAPILLKQRVAIHMEGRSTAATMIGQPVAMPVSLAPTGLTGMQHADGEILAAPFREAWARRGKTLRRARCTSSAKSWTTVAFCGHTQLASVDRSILKPRTYPTA